MSTMINTFHSSFSAPPVPPRQGHRGPMLPTNTPLVKFLSVVLLVVMLQTIGGFFYLFHRLDMMQYEYSDANLLQQFEQCKGSNLRPENEAKCNKLTENYNAVFGKGGVGYLTGSRLSTTPVARLVLKQGTARINDKWDSLCWDEAHSLVNIPLSSKGILTIQNPGYYFVYSQVTFSKGHLKVPLRQVIWTQKPKKYGKENNNWEKLLMSYCSLPQNSSAPDLCTASHAGVFEFEENQQLFVSVTGKDLVNAESSTFGLFKLQD